MTQFNRSQEMNQEGKKKRNKQKTKSKMADINLNIIISLNVSEPNTYIKKIKMVILVEKIYVVYILADKHYIYDHKQHESK